MTVDREGRVLLVSSDKCGQDYLYRVEEDTIDVIRATNFIPFNVDISVDIVITDRENRIWMVAGNHLARVGRHDFYDIVLTPNEDIVPQGEVESLTIDSQDKVWLGTDFHGIYIMSITEDIVDANEEVETPASLPQLFYPNPIVGTTSITYYLPQATRINLQLYDLMGRHLKTLERGRRNAGFYEIEVSANALQSGFYTLVTDKK